MLTSTGQQVAAHNDGLALACRTHSKVDFGVIHDY